MVWTTPTLAGASALAANLKRPEDPTRAVDEGDTDDASSEDAGPARQLVDGPARRGLAADGRVGGAPGWTRRPPPREPGPAAGGGQQKPRYRTQPHLLAGFHSVDATTPPRLSHPP